MTLPTYRWSVENFGPFPVRWSGEEPTIAGAKTAAEKSIETFSVFVRRSTVAATVFDARGGGWHARHTRRRVAWERWEATA